MKKTIEGLKEMSIMTSDLLAAQFFSRWDKERVEFVLRILQEKPELTVSGCRTELIDPLDENGGVRIFASADDDGTWCEFLLQIKGVSKNGKQARYNFALLNMEYEAEQALHTDIPERYLLFVSDLDLFGQRKAEYKIVTMNEETREVLDDGTHILYITGTVQEDTPKGRLMHDFHTSDPEKMYYPYMKDEMDIVKLAD